VKPYVSNKAYFDIEYGIRRDANWQFRIGNSLIEIDEDSNVTVRGKTYRGTEAQFELTRKKLNRSLITTRDLKNYKQILEVTSAHLENNEPSGDLKIRRNEKI